MATLSLTILNSRMTAEGKYAIYVRIAQKKEKSYINTGFLIDSIAEFEKGKVIYRKDSSILNKKLEYELKRYQAIYDELDFPDIFSANQLKSLLTKDKANSPISSFCSFFQRRIEEIEKEGRGGYAKMNRDTLRMFSLSEGEIPIQAITPSTIDRFDKWMKRRKHSDGGRAMRFSHIKARINEAIRAGIVKYDIHPFAYFKLPSYEPKQLDITIDEFIKIRDHQSESKQINLAKDAFLISFYLGGINLTDLVKVRFDKDHISYERTKTAGKKKDQSVKSVGNVLFCKYFSESIYKEWYIPYSSKLCSKCFYFCIK